MNAYVYYILLVIFVEALTEILVESSIFSRLREALSKNATLGELIHCGYCTSVWVSASVAWIIPIAFSSSFLLNYIITVFILHRLSNLLHEFYSKLLNRRPISFAVHKTETVIMPNLETNNDEQ